MPPSATGALRAVLAGAEPERPPFMVWKHFYRDDPRHLADATVAFYRRHRPSAAKIMPDVPLLFADRVLTSWSQLAQLRNISSLGRADDYVAAVAHTRDQLEPDDVVVATVFSPLALLGMWCGPEIFPQMLQAPAAQVHALLAELADGTARLLAECSAAGADAAYYSCWGQDVIGADRYQEFGIPYDLAGLRGAATFEMRLLHLHGGRGIDIGTFARYPVHAVGWSEIDTGIPLVDGAKHLPGKVPMGGMNERPAADPETIRSTTREHLGSIAMALGSRFIAAPGCSLPDDLADDGIGALGSAATSCM